MHKTFRIVDVQICAEYSSLYSCQEILQVQKEKEPDSISCIACDPLGLGGHGVRKDDELPSQVSLPIY